MGRQRLLSEGTEVARYTVLRLMMRAKGLRGAMYGRAIWTARTGPTARDPIDRVNREFTAQCPNHFLVSDFTYVSTWRGFVYVAFVIGVFARYIAG